MRAHRWKSNLIQPLHLVGFSLLMLIGVAACGTADQRAAATQASTPPATTAAPQQLSSPGTIDTTAHADQPASALPITPPGPTDQPAATAAPAKPAPSPVRPEPLNPTAVVTITPAPPVPTDTRSPAAAGAWQTYRNEQAGYAVDYPADWTASEQPSADGGLVTTFTPPGGARITIIVLPGGPHEEGSDMPNTRCQQVTIGGLSGTRCFDTIAFSTSTTLVGQGKTYTIAATGKGLNPDVYQRLLDSFRVFS